MKKEDHSTPIKKKGTIQIICGPMFSGKTEALIERLIVAKNLNLNTLAIKPLIDNRYSTHEIVSHSGTRIPAQVIGTTSELSALAGKHDFIAIDEAQFFTVELVKMCELLASHGTDMLLAGLDTDYLGQPFSPMPELFAIADEILKLTSVCSICEADAQYSHRIGEETQQVLVGASEQYTSLCHACFTEKMNKPV